MTRIEAPGILDYGCERPNIARARFTLLAYGRLLPVVNMFGSDSQRVANPLHAVKVVVYNAEAKTVNKFEVHLPDPGDVWPKRDEQWQRLK